MAKYLPLSCGIVTNVLYILRNVVAIKIVIPYAHRREQSYVDKRKYTRDWVTQYLLKKLK